VPETCAALDEGHPGATEVRFARLSQKQDKDDDSDEYVEQVQAGEDEVVQVEGVLVRSVALVDLGGVFDDLEADERQPARKRADQKRAVVSLAEGDRIEIFGS